MINVVIPTLDRYKSLILTLNTLKRTIKNWAEHDGNKAIKYKFSFRITVVVDGSKQYFRNLQNIGGITSVLNSERIGWGKSINRIMKETDDEYYFSASDDLEFLPGTLANAFKAMKERFPDGDGVIGINQNLKHFCPGAFVLVGRKFVNRFPDRQLYNPAYKHFCVDSELWHYAQSESKFFFCKDALVVHRRYQDDCHRLAQSTLRQDRLIWWAKKGRPERYWPKMKVVKHGN
jgi:hypothetical protein